MRGDERLGHRGGAGLVERVRHRRHAALVHDDAVREPAAADEAEDAIARLPAEHLRPAGLDRAGDLETGDVARAAGRRRVRALALRQIGGIEARVRDAHEHLFAARHGIGQLIEPDDLVAAGSGENHCAHVCSLGWILRGSLDGAASVAAMAGTALTSGVHASLPRK